MQVPKPPKRPRSTRPGRLKGAELEELRLACFERDKYQCQHVLESFEYAPWIKQCDKPVIWERGYSNSGHMAHIIPRSLGGPDHIDNVILKCSDCHIRLEHSMGQKGRP